MSDQFNIQYLTHQQIDKQKWDECINSADSGLIYASSFYLDIMSKQWDALVLNDYEAVMPITWNKKYGIRYLYQPFLAAQLGVFGKNTTEKIVGSFINSIPASFKYVDICLNCKNIQSAPADSTSERSNFILDLNKPYKTLFENYRENTQRNIKKALQLGCTIQKGFHVENVINLAVQQMKNQGNQEAENIERFKKLYHYLQQRNMATTYGVFSNQNELLASCVFFFTNNRAYYILVGNNPNGKTTGASHALIDALIKEHAGSKMILDFEGSDIPNLAFFYSSFGATLESYPALKINRLPFYLKWMKK